MSLADILQWADATGMTGTLLIERATGVSWVRIEGRSLVAMRRPDVRSVPVAQLHPELSHLDAPPLPDAQVAVEAFYDQFLDGEADFRFHRDYDAGQDESVSLSVWLPEVVMEGLRHKDEWPRITELYATDSARLHRAHAPSVAGLSVTQEAILYCADGELSLSDARLCLGLSRPALLRNVDSVRRLGLVVVDGAPQGGNLTDKLINQATQLLRQQQFAEAAHVFGSLLSADPGSARIKRLLREAEREQVEYLYARVPQSAVVKRLPRLQQIRQLSRADRLVVEQLNDRWDVATVVLASPLREVETLKSLDKLHRMEGVHFELPDACRESA